MPLRLGLGATIRNHWCLASSFYSSVGPRAFEAEPRRVLDEETVEMPVYDQSEVQGTLFSQALRENRAQPIPLEDANNNMTVIDAVFRSAANGQWIGIRSPS